MRCSPLFPGRHGLPDRRSFRRFAVVTLLTGAWLATGLGPPLPAQAARATTELDALERAIIDQIQLGFASQEVPTRIQNRCEGAFLRAKAVLEKDTTSLTGDVALLKKVIKATKNWFLLLEPIAAAADVPLASIGGKLEQSAVGLGDLLASHPPATRAELDARQKKALKRLEKIATQLEKRLTKAAEATTPQREAAQLLKASKLADKVPALEAQLPGPAAPAGRSAVAVGPDGNGVKQVFAVDFPESGSGPAITRQISNGSVDVGRVSTFTKDGSSFVAYCQGGDVFCADFANPAAGPVNFTRNVPSERTREFAISPLLDRISVSQDTGEYFVIDADHVANPMTGGAVPSGPGVGTIKWAPNGLTFVIESAETVPTVGRRLDAVNVSGATPVLQPIAGPSIDQTSAGDPSISPDGRYVAYAYITPTGPGTRLCVFDTTTGQSKEVHDSIVTIASSPDFLSSEELAGVWISSTELVFNGVPRLHVAAFPSGLASSTVSPLDNAGQFYRVYEQSQDDLFLLDSQSGVFKHVDTTSGPGALQTTSLGDAVPSNASSTLFEVIRTFIFTNVNPQGALELTAFDAAARTTAPVRTIESDPTKAARTFVLNLNSFSLPGQRGRVLVDNVSAEDDAKGGIRATVYNGVGAALDLTPLFGPTLLAAQAPGTEYDRLTIDPPDDSDVGSALFRYRERNFPNATRTPKALGVTFDETEGVQIVVFGLGNAFLSSGFTFWF